MTEPRYCSSDGISTEEAERRAGCVGHPSNLPGYDRNWRRKRYAGGSARWPVRGELRGKSVFREVGGDPCVATPSPVDARVRDSIMAKITNPRPSYRRPRPHHLNCRRAFDNHRHGFTLTRIPCGLCTDPVVFERSYRRALEPGNVRSPSAKQFTTLLRVLFERRKRLRHRGAANPNAPHGTPGRVLRRHLGLTLRDLSHDVWHADRTRLNIAQAGVLVGMVVSVWKLLDLLMLYAVAVGNPDHDAMFRGDAADLCLKVDHVFRRWLRLAGDVDFSPVDLMLTPYGATEGEEEIIATLFLNGSRSNAAAACGVSRKTVSRLVVKVTDHYVPQLGELRDSHWR